MAFVDELQIYAEAGKGGDGVVRWYHTKETEFGGPAGGNGGKGGDVYVKAVRDVHLLAQYRAKKKFKAERGENGKSKSLHGADGKDLIIPLPIGSVLTKLATKEKISLNKEGEKVLILKGGAGGRGNESYKSSTNRTPEQSSPGEEGARSKFFVEVELIADIGLIGLPSAGKTSLLNAITRARGKVGAYPFTTLEPNLGECYGYIISDIPGLIEGASQGKGLGHKFLRHVRRTKTLVHLVSLENEDPMKAYKTIREELKEFDPELLKKKEIILLTKTDVVDDPKIINGLVKKFKKISEHVFTVSLYDDDAVKELRENILKEADESAGK